MKHFCSDRHAFDSGLVNGALGLLPLSSKVFSNIDWVDNAQGFHLPAARVTVDGSAYVVITLPLDASEDQAHSIVNQVQAAIKSTEAEQ